EKVGIRKMSANLFMRRSKAKPFLKEGSRNEQVNMVIKETEIRGQVKMIDLTEEDLRILKAVKPLIEGKLPQMVGDFYERVMEIEHLKEIIYKYTSPEILQKAFVSHFAKMFDCNYDEGFIEARKQIALRHYQ